MTENWTEIKIIVATADIDAAGAIATMTVPYGIYIEDYSALEEEAMEIAKIDLIDEDLLAKDRTHGIIHIYISPEENPQEAVSFIENRLAAERIPYDIELDTCKKEDWMNNWKRYFKPAPVGEKLLIRPVWVDDYDPAGRTVLNLEPGVAFGTGTHETTRLCLEALERCVTPQTELLDVGCGSGILSVAAMLLGAKSAVGVDIDPLAVKVAAQNGALNGLSAPAYTVLQGNLTDRVSGAYDLVTANIVADAIIMLTPEIPQFLRPDGAYIVSGIIDAREDEVTAALAANGFAVADRRAENGFSLLRRRDENGWVCLESRFDG